VSVADAVTNARKETDIIGLINVGCVFLLKFDFYSNFEFNYIR